MYNPRHWDEELPWIFSMGTGKGWRVKLFKLASTETVYGAWHHKNIFAFGNTSDYNQIVDGIIEKIVYKGLFCKGLKAYIAPLMALWCCFGFLLSLLAGLL